MENDAIGLHSQSQTGMTSWHYTSFMWGFTTAGENLCLCGGVLSLPDKWDQGVQVTSHNLFFFFFFPFNMMIFISFLTFFFFFKKLKEQQMEKQ